jgi:hypothetical protein
MLIFLGCAMIDVGTFQDFAYLTSISHPEISMIFFFFFSLFNKEKLVGFKVANADRASQDILSKFFLGM